jgi:hypothetical protein
MAMEIQRQKLYYEEDYDEVGVWSDDNGRKADTAVIHNFSHDVESFYWLLLWTLTGRINHPASLAMARRVFQDTTHCSEDRITCLEKNELFKTELENLHPSLKHRLVTGSLNGIRSVLYKAYTRRADPRNLASYTALYDAMRQAITRCHEHVLAKAEEARDDLDADERVPDLIVWLFCKGCRR